VHGSQVTADHVGWPYKPEGLTSAQLNLPYCVATLLLEGDCFVDQFTEEMVADPKRMELSRKVQVIEDPAITARGNKFRHMTRVDIHFRDGTIESETREAPRGSEQSFATSDEIVDKFRKLTRAAMPKSQQDALVQAVLGMDDLPKATDLIRLLRTEGR
jgi:aconitate decarboxylase